jgi:hypothetical protein
MSLYAWCWQPGTPPPEVVPPVAPGLSPQERRAFPAPELVLGLGAPGQGQEPAILNIKTQQVLNRQIGSPKKSEFQKKYFEGKKLT